MDEARLRQAIEGLVGRKLATELAGDFVKLRQDVATGTLERTSAGKFVESFVQGLQQISGGSYDAAPSVDHYLNTQVEGDTRLPDGLRLCGSRIARAIYTLRNKRSIAHKGQVDPNSIDLEFTYRGAAWIMAELVRSASGTTMEEAGALIRLVNAPVGTLVEEIDGVRLVHAQIALRAEILVLLHSKHPDPVTSAQLCEWTGKKGTTVGARLSDLRSSRLVVGDGRRGFKLTSPGHAAATTEIQSLQG
ncbi:MAG: hypothetical protein F4210_05365 [Holophagales bacterium]|nr:hypothetical protein [Holophagales bacterium]MYF94931.1 hypothetical protein [Holophagales bacterium]